MKLNKRLSLTGLACYLTLSGIQTSAQEDSLVIALQDESVRYWVATKKSAPKYPLVNVKRKLDGCATVAYIIEADGTTSNHHVIASYPNGSFDKSAIVAAKKFRYDASSENPTKQPILTLNTFSYRIDNAHSSTPEYMEALSARCSTAAEQAMADQYGVTAN